MSQAFWSNFLTFACCRNCMPVVRINYRWLPLREIPLVLVITRTMGTHFVFVTADRSTSAQERAHFIFSFCSFVLKKLE